MTDVAKNSWEDFLPAIRNVISAVSGAAVTIGVMKSADQASLVDAVTHISADLVDIGKYLGAIGLILMPIWAHLSSSIPSIIKSLKRKAPTTVVVAPPAIAAVTPAVSSTEVAVVDKVSGQAVKP